MDSKAKFSVQGFKRDTCRKKKIFDSRKEVMLMMDVSDWAVSAILLQEGHPIMYLWRRLTTAEINYPN